jgi:hypothetical protein
MIGEACCPFCAASVEVRQRPSPRMTGATRAAIFYLGATLAGCDEPVVQPYGAPPEPPGETIAQPYGAPPDPEPPPEPVPQPVPEAADPPEGPPPELEAPETIAQPYGAPPPPPPLGSGGEGGFGQPYGAAPIPPTTRRTRDVTER